MEEDKMRRAITIVPAVLAATGALMLILGQPNSVFGGKGKSCAERILAGGDSRLYNCEAEVEGDGSGVPMGLEFFAPPPGGPEDLNVIVNESVTGACSCLRRGKIQGRGAKFRCIMDNLSIGDNTSVGDFNALGATIEGKPKKKGQAIKGTGADVNGISITYTCEEAPL
jgi:hypothetical protein